MKTKKIIDADGKEVDNSDGYIVYDFSDLGAATLKKEGVPIPKSKLTLYRVNKKGEVFVNGKDQTKEQAERFLDSCLADVNHDNYGALSESCFVGGLNAQQVRSLVRAHYGIGK